jgi:MFS family permease
MTEMEMYCDSKLAISGFASLFLIGFVFGSLILNWSNKFGRKPALYFGTVYTLIGVLLC